MITFCRGTLNQKRAFAQDFITVDAVETAIVSHQKVNASDSAENTEESMFAGRSVIQAHVMNGRRDITLTLTTENVQLSRTEDVKATEIGSFQRMSAASFALVRRSHIPITKV